MHNVKQRLMCYVCNMNLRRKIKNNSGNNNFTNMLTIDLIFNCIKC